VIKRTKWWGKRVQNCCIEETKWHKRNQFCLWLAGLILQRVIGTVEGSCSGWLVTIALRTIEKNPGPKTEKRKVYRKDLHYDESDYEDLPEETLAELKALQEDHEIILRANRSKSGDKPSVLKKRSYRTTLPLESKRVSKSRCWLINSDNLPTSWTKAGHVIQKGYYKEGCRKRKKISILRIPYVRRVELLKSRNRNYFEVMRRCQNHSCYSPHHCLLVQKGTLSAFKLGRKVCRRENARVDFG